MGGDAPLRVRVLGSIRVVDARGADLTPEGPLQQRLFALLVLRRGLVVSADAAIDTLWPNRPPRDPAAALQNHVFRLRRGLPDGVIESVADGYRLVTSRVRVDADRLPVLLGGDTTVDNEVLAELAATLDHWRGPAYPELSDTDGGRAESTRLDALRLRARELHADRRLVLGDTDGLVAELVTLVGEEPLRERPRALLMSALAATGRRVEALRAFDDFRRLLGDELGIEPSPVLIAQHADLLGAVDAARTSSRLPLPVTSLVGRESLLVEVTASVEDHRLVTLVGPGGVGKTRLAIEVGGRLADARPERPVVVCELAAGTTESALDMVAAALSIDPRPGVAATDRVASVLGASDVIVVLDNCEHVLGPIAEFAGHLLVTCPNVRVVATSRERLRVPGENVRVVPPLAFGAESSPSVALFVQRARAMLPAFDPDPEDLANIAEIVRRLDGLPLAIELAAACLHVHDVAEIAAGLDARFALLSTGYRSSARHGSLHAAVAWSFELLDARLQQLFSELSIFAGSFTVADAAAIGASNHRDVAVELAELVERSLVVRVPGGRYALLETLRAFAAEQLAPASHADLLGERHARWFVDWVERADRRLHLPGEPVLTEIDDAIPELHAALDWLLDHGFVEHAGRLVAALIHYAVLRLRPDVLAWAERVVAADPDDGGPAASLMWAASAYYAWMAGDLAGSGANAARAVAIAEREPDGMSQIVATVRGNLDLFEGRLDAAADWYRRGVVAGDDPTRQLVAAGTELLALGYADAPGASAFADSLLRSLGDDETAVAAYVWYCAGEAAMGVDVDLARRRLGRAIELAEVTNASFVRGVAGASRASIEARVGDPTVAAADYRWLIPHWQRAGMWSTQWTMLRSIVGLLERLGRYRDAAVLAGAVTSTEGGHRIFGADERALDDLGDRLRAALGEGDYRRAFDEGAGLGGDAAIAHALRAL